VRKLCLGVVLLLAVTVPLAAQEQSCFDGALGTWCQFIANADFEGLGSWTYSLASRSTVTDPCWGGTTKAAVLAPNGYALQTVNTTDYAEWAVEFDAFFSDSGGTTYDKVMVNVTNNTTGYSEGYAIYATQYGTCAKQVYLPLAGSYANSSVTVRVKRYSGSTMSSIAVDNVLLWGGPYN